MEPISKLNALQIEEIINRVVPMIAAPEDHEFFKGILYVKAEESNSTQFTAFIAKLLAR
jgi:hypothetical protein